MKLVVSTPLAVIVETDDVVHLRAEDATGAFGILSGHVDFLTVLATSVATWRDRGGAEHHVALRGGILTVTGGDTIAVAARDAAAADDLHYLEADVLARYRREMADEQAARVDVNRLYLAALRQIARLIRSDANQPGFPRRTGDGSEGIV